MFNDHRLVKWEEVTLGHPFMVSLVVWKCPLAKICSVCLGDFVCVCSLNCFVGENTVYGEVYRII